MRADAERSSLDVSDHRHIQGRQRWECIEVKSIPTGKQEHRNDSNLASDAIDNRSTSPYYVL